MPPRPACAGADLVGPNPIIEPAHDLHQGHGGHAHAPSGAHAPTAPSGPGRLSPLWWSTRQRVAVAVALIAVLWLVIAWALQ